MKVFLLLTLLTISNSMARAQENPDFDQALADSLKADDYGMRMYYFVVLKTGENNNSDQEFLKRIFGGHMENIRKLSEEGKLVVAGPFGKNDAAYRGLLILNANSIEEAAKLVKSDPAVAENVFAYDIFPWYGSAALGVYLDTHKKIAKNNP